MKKFGIKMTFLFVKVLVLCHRLLYYLLEKNGGQPHISSG